MELLTGIFTAFGLSASAGLNAYIPLLMVALLGRYTNLMQLTAPWDTLTNPWIILLLCILVIIEMLADKVPAVNHLNDALQTFIRPVAGAIVFAASANVVSDIHPVLALACGSAGRRDGACCQGGSTPPGGHRDHRRRRQYPRIHCGGYHRHRDVLCGDRPSHPCRHVPDRHCRVHHFLAV